MKEKYKIINNKDLIKLRKVHLEILREIERICKKHDLSFFLVGGSLLGAVRHKGYIPWDDDLDIGMTREDFNKFREVIADEIDDKYFFDYFDTDMDYYLPFAKVRKNNTTFAEKASADIDVHKGIFVDIFVYERTDSNYRRNYIKALIIQVLSRTVLLKKKLLSKEKCNYYYLSSIFRIFSSNSILKFIDYFSSNFNGKKKNQDHVVCFNSLVGLKKDYHCVDDMFPLCELEFENISLPVVKNYDKHLTLHYGDYMKLPPEEERVNHMALYLSFDKGKNIKNKK